MATTITTPTNPKAMPRAETMLKTQPCKDSTLSRFRLRDVFSTLVLLAAAYTYSDKLFSLEAHHFQNATNSISSPRALYTAITDSSLPGWSQLSQIRPHPMLPLEPMPAYKEATWSITDQCLIIAFYFVLIVLVRKYVIERIWTSTFDRIQMRKLLVAVLMVPDFYRYMAIDDSGVTVFPIWAEVGMVLDNLVFLRADLMTDMWKWGHDLGLLATQFILVFSLYQHDADRIYSRQWTFLHGALFFLCWSVESAFLFFNHKQRVQKTNKVVMRFFYAVTLLCCFHNIIHLLVYAFFVFDTKWVPCIITTMFASQWACWASKIAKRGTR